MYIKLSFLLKTLNQLGQVLLVGNLILSIIAMAAIKEFSIFPSEEDIQPSRQPLTIESNLPFLNPEHGDMPSFIINKPWSTRADQEGIFTAKFLLDNADKVKSTSAKRDILQSALNEELGADSLKIEVRNFIAA